MGLSKLLPFPIPILLSKGDKLEGGGGGGPSHNQKVGVPIKKGFAEQGHFVPDLFRIRLRSTDAGFLTKRFLKVDARVPIAEGDLNRHGAEGLTVGGGGVFPLVFVLNGTPTHKLNVFHTGEGVFDKSQRFGGVLILFSAEVHGFTGQVH